MKVRALVSWIAAVAALMVAVSAASGAPLGAPAKLSVNVGGGSGTIAANDFFPDAVTIHVGDTIHFTSPYPEIHTVTFLPTGMAVPALVVPGPSGPPQFGFNPVAATPTYTGTSTTLDSTKLLNSGILNKGDFVDVTFPHAGTFHFVCIVHGPSMSEDVTVVPAANAADAQPAIDTRAASQEQALVIKGQTAASAIQPSPASVKLADGSTQWNDVIGGETAEAAIDQFFPANITVNAGDTVTWTNPLADVPHTVTFTSGAALPPLVTPAPQPSGPPFIAFTPQLFLPTAAKTYDGTGFVNSGFLQQGTPAATYSLKFTKPGTYTYVCAIHADQGMKGTITVLASQISPSPTPPGGVVAPNTGTGPGNHGQSLGPWLLLVGVLGFALALVGLKARAHGGA